MTPALDLSRPSLIEALGLRPLGERLQQALVAVRGDDDVPPGRFGVSSLALLRPRLSLPLWAGREVVPRRVILTALFNRRQTPISDGWSVRRGPRIQDYRGRELTYDSHNGTDFSIPIGTPVVAPADGLVVRIWAEFNRGGQKVAIDHGDGLMTTSGHLSRVLCREGDRVRSGQLFALSGYSGLDSLVTFPWGVPHVHFNVWLDGVPIDPFARPGETSLWVGDGLPRPAPAPFAGMPTGMSSDGPAPSSYDLAAVDRVIASCITPRVRDRLAAIEPASRRAPYLVTERNYYPTRFPDDSSLYDARHPRQSRLHMPVGADRFDGVVFADELY